MTKKFSDFKINTETHVLVGKRVDIEDIFDETIMIHRYNIVDSKFPKEGCLNKCLHLQISIAGAYRVVFTISKGLMNLIKQVPEDGFPFETKIVKVKETKGFTFM